LFISKIVGVDSSSTNELSPGLLADCGVLLPYSYPSASGVPSLLKSGIPLSLKFGLVVKDLDGNIVQDVERISLSATW
jgi:hypothetical protein